MPKYGMNKYSKFKYGRYRYSGEDGALLKSSRFKVRSLNSTSRSLFLVESRGINSSNSSSYKVNNVLSQSITIDGRIRRSRIKGFTAAGETPSVITESFIIERKED